MINFIWDNLCGCGKKKGIRVGGPVAKDKTKTDTKTDADVVSSLRTDID
jgi:hypothetical protein